MNIYKLLTLAMLLVCVNAYGAYTGTMPKDIGTSTPLGSENPNVIDDVLRERGTILYNMYKLKFVGTDTTLAANDSWVVGSSSTPFLITMPAASSCASSSVTKPFVITNYSTGTITLNISVDGVGSPTVSGSQTLSLFTDGTNWYEIRSKNAYDSDYLGGVIASGYARSGANSDITSITGLTTYLPINQGGSGTNTAAGAASAFGVGTEDSPTFTGVTATTGSTTTHTSTTITATTGNITNVSSTAGTFTGNLQVGSMSGLEDADIPNDITLTNITQITNRSHNDITGTGTYSHTSIDSHIDDTSDPHGASLTQTNATITTGTVTTLYAPTGNVTNLTTTTGTVTTLYNTNFSGNAGTFSGNLNISSVSGFNYLSRWRSGNTIGTGTVAIEGSGDIIVTPTYSNANGTITISLSGSASAKPDINYNGSQIIGNASDINFTSPLRVVGSGSTEAVVSLDNISLGTQTNGLLSLGTQTSGTVNLSTQTNGLLSLGTQTSGLLSLGTQTSGLLSLGTQTSGTLPFASMSGSVTAEQLPTVIKLPGTTTEQVAGAYGQLYVRSNGVGGGLDSYTKLLLHMNNPGTSTFVDSSDSAHTVTAVGSAIGTTTAKFGSGSLYTAVAGDYLTVPDSEDWNVAAGDFTIDFWVYHNTAIGSNETYAGQTPGGSLMFFLRRTTTGIITFFYSTNGSGWATTVDTTETVSSNAWHHIALVRNGATTYIFIDGVAATLSSNISGTLYNSTGVLNIASYGSDDTSTPVKGYIDEFRFSKGIARWTSNFTPLSAPYAIPYTQYSAKYKDPVNGNTVFEILTPGTVTTEASYIYNNATTTVWGLGTNTAVTGTASGAYAGWTNRPIRVLAIDIGSSKEIKENIKTIKIKPDLLDAEGLAKQNYIAGAKAAWIAAHQAEYEITVNETGTGSVTHVDLPAMESDYNNYIELEWASDMNQDVYTETVQKQHEKGFWQMFDSVTPKSWNPKDNPGAEYEGFVVGEMPPVVWGDDKQSVNLMSVVAYIAVVQQALKADTIFALSTLKELITTGTVTQQKIDYCNDRLEVLNP